MGNYFYVFQARIWPKNYHMDNLFWSLQLSICALSC